MSGFSDVRSYASSNRGGASRARIQTVDDFASYYDELASNYGAGAEGDQSFDHETGSIYSGISRASKRSARFNVSVRSIKSRNQL